jgi:hypothetical protein
MIYPAVCCSSHVHEIFKPAGNVIPFGTVRGQLALALVMLTTGCAAEPPQIRDGSTPQPTSARYATLGFCAARAEGAAPCPGPSCATNALGPKDSLGVDLANCLTLDLTLTGGLVRALSSGSASGADLAIHLVGSPTGRTRVECSADGQNYALVSYVNQGLGNTPPDCVATAEGERALIDFNRCNVVDNVQYVRLTLDRSVASSLVVDAIEALSFSPISAYSP